MGIRHHVASLPHAYVIIRRTLTIQQMFRIQISLIVILSLGASTAWTIVAGQDLNFDLITYHYYVGYSAFAQRFQLDFLAASFQGYQSPLPYTPLYLLDSIGTPPVVIASLHAAVHALNLILLYLLAEFLAGNANTGPERIKVLACWFLGAIAPIYWTLVGTSFADLLTSAPVLAGVWFVARAISIHGRRPASAIFWTAVGAALTGAAAGVRMHNSLYVVGLLCAIGFTQFPDWNSRLRVIGAFSLSAFAGWLLCFAPWAYRLYEEFGNPLFPFFNGVFRSPDFPTSNLPLTSFTPGNLWDLLTLPFWMATDSVWVYTEIPLPDVRPALLALCLPACGLLWLFNRGKKTGVAGVADTQAVRADAGAARSRRVILIFFAVSTILWLATSSNGRYGVALFLLGGPVCSVLLSRFLPSRHVLLVIAAVVLWQASLEGVFFRQHRFNSMPWTTRYFDWEIPDRLKREPATFISFGYQPASTLVPHVHSESAHVNLSGHPAIDAPGSERIRQIIGFPNRRIYGVFDVTLQNVRDSSSFKTYLRNQVGLWGLDFTEEPCQPIMLKPAAEDWAWLNRIAGVKARYRPPTFLVCELRRSSPVDLERAMEEFRMFTRKLAGLGAACPQYFSKPLGYVHTYKQWIVKSFASSENRLEFDHEGRFYLRQLRPPRVALDLGQVTRDSIVADEPDCRKWFSRLAELSSRSSRADGPTPSSSGQQ